VRDSKLVFVLKRLNFEREPIRDGACFSGFISE